MTQRLRTAVRVVSALTALQLLNGGPLAAQPACAVATLEQYYALGAGGCSLGGVRLTDFDGISDIHPRAVDVTPTIDGDWIGFRMIGRLRATAPEGFAIQSYQLAFRAQSVLVSGIRTRALGPTASGSGNRFFAWGGSIASAQDAPYFLPAVLGAGFVDREAAEAGGGGEGRIPRQGGACTPAVVGCTVAPDLVQFAPIALSFFNTRAKAEAGAALGSSALATVEGHHFQYRVTVTPEPRAVVLLLLGVAMMGAILVRTGRVRL